MLEQFSAPHPSASVVPSEDLAGDAFMHALSALEHFVLGEFDAMSDPVAAALRLVVTDGSDPDALALTRAVAGFTIAGWSDAATDPELRDPVTGKDPLDAAAADLTQLSPPLRSALLHLLTEAALACARVDLATRFIERAGAVPSTIFGRDHSYLTVMRVLHVRVAVFHGEITHARDLVGAAVDGAHGPVELMFAKAVECLVDGSFDARTST